MVAPVAGLRHGGAAELAAEYHQGVVQHAPLLQVVDQRGGGLVYFLSLEQRPVLDGRVMVPVTVG